MKKFFLICFLPLVFVLTSGWHKFYVSITQVDYVPQEQSIQIITRLFYDDLQKALQERYDSDIRVEKSYDQQKLDFYIEKYINQKFIVDLNHNKASLKYLGHKDENDYTVCFIEITGVEAVHSLEIENTLLMDVFPEQKNVVHAKIGESQKSFMLSEGRETAVLNNSK